MESADVGQTFVGDKRYKKLFLCSCESCITLTLTFIVVTWLYVAGLVLDPLSFTVLPSIVRHRVSALPVGELHPTSTRPRALLPRSPRAPAAVHNHLR